ncbi:DUF2786 domain-containing protein [Micromonospora echinofusca]|uniref:DUF2786 domain-containing protein n=1 Tax=Micromonospora echinofusca TaxID=47858 RepID=A0ABS3VPI1_MICEH|nr:DUF2786 domain-containing protein [Micromonospora echinofusca]MBO4206453.1 DUF2786 domain-containing protein [Micromonospora echinofusca]
MADADALVSAAVTALRGPDTRATERHLDQLVVGPGGPDGVVAVDTALFRRLERAVGRLWTRGWQPVDVARIATRRTGPRTAQLVVDLLAAERRGHPAGTVGDWWDAQLDALDARVRWDRDEAYLTGFAAREGTDRIDVLRNAVEAVALLESLPPVALLRPPPGGAPVAATGPVAGSAGGSGSRMLDRVRALLAKAESTGYPEEAEALTAKAQELMARHSIDDALLATGGPQADQPGGLRLGTDSPYEAAKALLVQQVAEANRCSSVWQADLGFATVLGYPADLDAVELLYTSLLVQATTAMLRGRTERRRAGGGRRTRSYDESFLNAFALRIGERLRHASEQASRQAVADEGNDRLLPVLAARSDAVRERVDALFPGVRRQRLTIRDDEGWLSGTAAADRAALGAPAANAVDHGVVAPRRSR